MYCKSVNTKMTKTQANNSTVSERNKQLSVPILRFKVRSTDAWRTRAYNGGLGRSPQWGPGAEPLDGGKAPLKLKAF